MKKKKHFWKYDKERNSKLWKTKTKTPRVEKGTPKTPKLFWGKKKKKSASASIYFNWENIYVSMKSLTFLHKNVYLLTSAT